MSQQKVILIGILVILLLLIINIFLLLDQRSNHENVQVMKEQIENLDTTLYQITKTNKDLTELYSNMSNNWDQISEHYMDKKEFDEIMEANHNDLQALEGNLKSVANFLLAFKELNKYFNINKVPSKFELLNVYGIEDIDTFEMTVEFCVKVPDELTLSSKVEYFTSKVSSFRYVNNLNFKGIDKIEGKQIAKIEFVDNQNRKTKWNQAFQGSTGGAVTTNELKYIFLQPDYSGHWIDGVQFYYENKPFVDKDHTSLSGILMRDDLIKKKSKK